MSFFKKIKNNSFQISSQLDINIDQALTPNTQMLISQPIFYLELDLKASQVLSALKVDNLTGVDCKLWLLVVDLGRLPFNWQICAPENFFFPNYCQRWNRIWLLFNNWHNSALFCSRVQILQLKQFSICCWQLWFSFWTIQNLSSDISTIHVL